jgi:hypothetical protein
MQRMAVQETVQRPQNLVVKSKENSILQLLSEVVCVLSERKAFHVGTSKHCSKQSIPKDTQPQSHGDSTAEDSTKLWFLSFFCFHFDFFFFALCSIPQMNLFSDKPSVKCNLNKWICPKVTWIPKKINHLKFLFL